MDKVKQLRSGTQTDILSPSVFYDLPMIKQLLGSSIKTQSRKHFEQDWSPVRWRADDCETIRPGNWLTNSDILTSGKTGCLIWFCFPLILLDLLNNILSNTGKKGSGIPFPAVFPYPLGLQGYYFRLQGYYFYSNLKLLQNPVFFERMLWGIRMYPCEMLGP